MLRSLAVLVGAGAVVVCTGSCMSSSSPAAPTESVPPITVNGTWNGSLADSQGAAKLTWTITQNGSALSGVAVTRPVDPNDGTCASCHKDKTGTVTGTLTGTAMTLTMTFPGGQSGEPTPICSVTLNATVPALAGDAITATYQGTDTCEGPVENGKIGLSRQK